MLAGKTASNNAIKTPTRRRSRGAKANSLAAQDFRYAADRDHCRGPWNVGRRDREEGRGHDEVSRARDDEEQRERETLKGAHGGFNRLERV
jgi:hypothetical protein